MRILNDICLFVCLHDCMFVYVRICIGKS